MEKELFLRYLRDYTLEEGRAYIREHITALADHTIVGEWLADEALRLLYTPFLSLKIAELLIFFGELTGHLSSHALGLKAKGDVLSEIRHHEAALEHLDAAAQEFLAVGDKANWARSRISWVTSAGWLGRIDDTLQVAEQARLVFSQLNELYWVGVINNNVAVIYEFRGQYQEALKLYEQILAIFATATDQNELSLQRSIAITQVNQARSLSLLGDLISAYELLQQAQASFTTLKETALVHVVEYELAHLDYTQGYYGSALRRYYQALDGMTQENVENPFVLAELKLYMANCLVKLDRAREACLVSEEAVKIYRQSGMAWNTGNALYEHAKALLAANRLEAAIGILDEAWTLFTHGGFEPYAFATRLQQAEILLQMGLFTPAYAQAREVKRYYDAQGLVIRSLEASLLIASALIANARQSALLEEKELQAALFQEAVGLCRQVIFQARQHHLQGEIYKGHYLLGKVFALQHKLSRAAKHYAAAIAQIERMLDDLVYDLSPSFLRTTWAVYDDMIALCLQQSQPEKAFYYLEQARSMALRQRLGRSGAALPKSIQAGNAISPMILRTQYELRDWQEQHRKYSTLLTEIDTSLSPELRRDLIATELKHCEEKLNELFERLYLYEASFPAQSATPRSRKVKRREQAIPRIQHTDIAQIRQYLTPDHLLLSYYFHQGKLVIFAITAEKLMVYEQPDGQAELEHLLLLLHANFQAQGKFGTSASQGVLRRLLKKLYMLLIAPITSLLPRASGCVTIVPYNSLHKLPFHALYDGSRFLIEHYQINYLPASSLLTHLALRIDQCQDTGKRTVRRPPLVFGYSYKGHLQRVHDEARAIASLLGGDYYLEEEATIARLLQQAPSSPLLHIATHGRNRLDAPNFSYVRLADGQLNALDAFSLDLHHCELVTLSGCETGLALSGGGDEQLGLATAFLAAGAASLVISLWAVEDTSTNELMRHFYQHLLQGESKVQALRSAQCKLLRQTDSRYAHPYFWAGFRLVGDVSPLKYHIDHPS
ncbi:CHAT domain-containing protein [Reticulibacter mediterranei]|uniref:CHAT domain-containing protein n=1 Tax=Reticulibacter mediterranei TaxID=2778369 RepID=A0A8J3J084_9CHLR|nr:CHAT domain-containing tetratricopeptide repeat protein [Reticulibacter mediterranei]GHO99972.1 CHAT domain-containing protein [Reticulibacter mediterranei]